MLAVVESSASLTAPPALPSPAELAESRLQRNSYLALKHIACEYHDGVLLLRGRVPTYYLKQLALAAVAGVAGVHRVVDLIDVCTSAGRGR